MSGRCNVQDSMISKLRRKLLATHVAFAFIALLVLGAVIVYVDYQQQEQAVYEALSHALDMDNKQEVGPLGAPVGQSEVGSGLQGVDFEGASGLVDANADETSSPDVDGGYADSGDHEGDTGEFDEESFVIGNHESPVGIEDGSTAAPIRRKAPDTFIATSVYDVDANSVVQVRMNSLSFDSQTAEQALELVQARTSASQNELDSRGKISSLGLYYVATTMPDGSMKVAFASENYVRQTMEPLLWSLLLAGGVALVGFVTISAVLARWSVKPVELAWRQQQQFVADASHELKTPIAVILANNSLIMSDPKASVASQMKWVESTETEAHLMQDLVNDMLYLAKSEFDQHEEAFGRLNFSDIVLAGVLQFESVAFERNVMIEDDIADNVYVRGDASRLQRLVGTLVDNACKYADDGGLVGVKLSTIGQGCCLTVTNTGPGIDPEDLPHLFDRFYRSDKARTRGTGGFGLGLSIAKGVVDELGGEIHATSDTDKGTTFTVKLPTCD